VSRAYFTLIDRTGYSLHSLEWEVPYVTVMLMLTLAQEAKSDDLQIGAFKNAFK